MMSRRAVVEIGSLVAAALLALAVRHWLVAVYVIPSESMLPRLMVGDYLLVEKWAFAQRPAALPKRGDVVVFHAPPSGRSDYVKRVIGLPGDRVALRKGVPSIGGTAFPRWRVADLLVAVTRASPCPQTEGGWARVERNAAGIRTCRYRRFREMLPGGRMVDVLDLGAGDGDDFGPVTVPAGHLFLLGDNRDRSADSRFPARDGGAVGMVPIANLVGRAGVTLFSVDGSARLASPRTWWRAIRWERIGGRF